MAPRSRKRISADADRAETLAEILKAVAHPMRLRIVAILSERETNVSELAERLDAAPAIVSQQLRILRSHGLVAATRVEGFAHYRLLEERLRDLVHCMEGCER